MQGDVAEAQLTLLLHQSQHHVHLEGGLSDDSLRDRLVRAVAQRADSD